MSVPDISKAAQLGKDLANLHLDIDSLFKRIDVSTEDLKQFKTIGDKAKAFTDRFKNVEKEFKDYTSKGGKGFKQGEEINRMTTDFKKAKAKIQEIDKTVDKVIETGEGGNKLSKATNIGKTIAGAGNFLTKFAPLIAFVATVGVSVFVNELQGWRADMAEKGQESLSASVSKVLGILNVYKDRIENNRKAIAESKLADQRTRDRIYSLEKEQPKIQKNANDALYETRKGREIIEKKIDSQSREVVSLKAKFEQSLKGLDDNFKQAINTTIENLKTGLKEAKEQANRANSQATKANDLLNLQSRLITGLQDALTASQKAVDSSTKAAQDATNKITKALPVAITGAVKAVQKSTILLVEANIIPVQKATQRWGVTITPATITPATITVSDTGGLTITPSTGGMAQVTYSDFSTSDIAREIALKNEQQDKRITTLDNVVGAVGGGLSAVATGVAQAQATANTALEEAKLKGSNFSSNTKNLENDINKIKIDINEIKDGAIKIDTKIKEQEKVNATAIPKLDQILGFLPLIPGRAAAAIRPDIATLSQIEAAAAAGSCRTAQPGGCISKALNDNAANINNNTNNKVGNVLDAVNTGANAALLVGQQTILARLGDQLPGGIGGKLSRFADWMHLDRVLNLMIWATTIHNGLMLSNNLGQTLFSMISNILSVIGLKNAEGEAFDIGSVISAGFENIIKSAIGAENYKTLSTTWKNANRIYQATANLFNAVQSIGASVLNALEVVGQWNAKVGNALRRFGAVGEKAYGWMNPNVDFSNKWFTAIENATNVISQIDQVASEVLSIKETVGQITEQRKELDASLKEIDTSKQKIDLPEAVKVAQKEQESKIASASLPIVEADKEPDEDN